MAAAHAATDQAHAVEQVADNICRLFHGYEGVDSFMARDVATVAVRTLKQIGWQPDDEEVVEDEWPSTQSS